MEFGGFDVPLAMFALVAADFGYFDRPQKRRFIQACRRRGRCKG
jgi:hypothetical protein